MGKSEDTTLTSDGNTPTIYQYIDPDVIQWETRPMQPVLPRILNLNLIMRKQTNPDCEGNY